jgi:adenylate cyclase
VHTGDAVATRDDVVGHVVNVAARVCEAAKGGQVLVSDDVREAAGARDGVRFGRSRVRRMKGFGSA